MGTHSKMIIVAVMALAIVNYSRMVRDGLHKAKAGIATIELAKIDQLLQQADYPKDQAAFEQFLRDKLEATGRDRTLDQWGNPFKYERLGRHAYTLASAGQDGMLGTEDDDVLQRDGNDVRMSRSLADVEKAMMQQAEELQGMQKTILGTLTDTQQRASAISLLEQMDDYLNAYRREHGGEYPEDLAAYVKAQDAEFREAGLKDPWGNDVSLTRTAHGYTARSAGPDGGLDTDDDVCLERIDDTVRTTPSLAEVLDAVQGKFDEAQKAPPVEESGRGQEGR